MAKYWVGGTGNWSDATNHWATTSGGAPGSGNLPTATDDVFFDSASHSSGYTVTIDATTKLCRDITFAAPASGNVTWAGSTAMTISGSIALYSGLVRTFTGVITMNATSGTKTITSAGIQLSSLTLNGAGGTFQLADAFSIGTFTNTAGTFDANGKTTTFSGQNLALAGTQATTFYNLTITGDSSKVAVWSATPTSITVTNNLTINGNSTTNRVLIRNITPGTTTTINAANVSVTNADFRDITGAGAGSWNLASITGNSGDCGGNSGITFTTAATQHWLNASSSTWSTAANWTSRVPLPQDDVVMDKAFGTSQTVTADMPRLGKSIDFTGATWTTSLTFSVATNISIFGSCTLISGLTVSTASRTWSFLGRGTASMTCNGVTMSLSAIRVEGPGQSFTFSDNIDVGFAVIYCLGGTVNFNNISCICGSLTGQSPNTSPTVNLGSSTIQGKNTSGTVFDVTHFTTFNAGTSTLKVIDTGSSPITFAGAGKTFSTVWFARGASTATLTISGSNTFADFKDTGTAAHTIKFTTGTTQTVTTFTVSGSSGNVVTIDSTTTGTHTLSAPSKNNASPISCDYLNIQHSIVSQANTWYAGANSVNNQGVATAGSGWIFTVPTIVSTDTSSFFQLF